MTASTRRSTRTSTTMTDRRPWHLGAYLGVSIAAYAAMLAAVTAGQSAADAAAKQTKLATAVIAAENVNPNYRGAAQPVKLYIFYLANDDKFMQANFADLVAEEPAILGDELVRRAEHLVGPGETLPLDEAFDEAAKFIGVVAAFTEIDSASWRAIAQVPARRWTAARNEAQYRPRPGERCKRYFIGSTSSAEPRGMTPLSLARFEVAEDSPYETTARGRCAPRDGIPGSLARSPRRARARGRAGRRHVLGRRHRLARAHGDAHQRVVVGDDGSGR